MISCGQVQRKGNLLNYYDTQLQDESQQELGFEFFETIDQLAKKEDFKVSNFGWDEGDDDVER